jgi:hypothetical protein
MQLGTISRLVGHKLRVHKRTKTPGILRVHLLIAVSSIIDRVFYARQRHVSRKTRGFGIGGRAAYGHSIKDKECFSN